MEKIGLIIKQHREGLGISMRSLAKKIGLSASFLSQVESGKTYPSLQSLKKIADALHTTIGIILGEKGSITSTTVLREKERKSLKNIGKGVVLQFLSSLDKNNRMEPCIQRLNAHSISGNPPFQHYGQEFVYVLEGDIEITLGNDTHEMKKGECIYFDSDIQHYFKNTCEESAEILIISSPPFF